MSASAPAKPGKSAYDRALIEKEIEHLKKKPGVRSLGGDKRSMSKVLITLVLLGAVSLYVMDPFVFSYNRSDAMRVYLYLHSYGSPKKAQALAQCGLLTAHEVAQLDVRDGNFQGYFSDIAAANQRATELIDYMNRVHALHNGNYDSLSAVDKIRYYLFIKTGLVPPISWQGLDSSIDK